MHELESWKDSTFVTLTYDDDHLPLLEDGSPTLERPDLVKYIKRLRRDFEPIRIKYFAAGEYGENTDRPHYHAILFGVGADDKRIDENWLMGFTYSGTVTYQSARYVASYLYKKYDGMLAEQVYGQRTIPFALQSKGLGKKWVVNNEKYIRDNEYITINGSAMPIPRYYRKLLGIETDQDKIEQKMVLKSYEKELVMIRRGVSEVEEWNATHDSLNQTKINQEALISIRNNTRKL